MKPPAPVPLPPMVGGILNLGLPLPKRQPFFFVKTAAISCERATHWRVSGG